MLTECDFSYAHYRNILRQLLKAEYYFFSFSDFIERKKEVNRLFLLRHDVDKSVTKALDMARIEKELGIRATYFIRIHSNYYNPFGHICYNQIREIMNLGHEIGLHSEFYDAARISGENSVRGKSLYLKRYLGIKF